MFALCDVVSISVVVTIVVEVLDGIDFVAAIVVVVVVAAAVVVVVAAVVVAAAVVVSVVVVIVVVVVNIVVGSAVVDIIGDSPKIVKVLGIFLNFTFS